MRLANFFKMALEKQATDLLIAEGSVPAIRIDGDLIRLAEPATPYGELAYAISIVAGRGVLERVKQQKDIDFSLVFYENRFRVNLHYQKGKLGLAARLIKKKIPTPKAIGLSEDILKLSRLKDGIILVTGPSGSGKTTTLATLLEQINIERKSHIITIEDPVEYVFEEKQSMIEQREIGRDTPTFASALKYSLRQNPDIIMVGEMRDVETIQAALIAAKTGHLVISTIHTISAPETIERIIDYFPAQDFKKIASSLSIILRAVITQRLLPKLGGGLVAAREVMITNRAIANMIRNMQTEQIYSVLQTNQDSGMVTMNTSINTLLEKRLISPETAGDNLINLETMSASYLNNKG
jgi:twitching motility protein PilT